MACFVLLWSRYLGGQWKRRGMCPRQKENGACSKKPKEAARKKTVVPGFPLSPKNLTKQAFCVNSEPHCQPLAGNLTSGFSKTYIKWRGPDFFYPVKTLKKHGNNGILATQKVIANHCTQYRYFSGNSGTYRFRKRENLYGTGFVLADVFCFCRPSGHLTNRTTGSVRESTVSSTTRNTPSTIEACYGLAGGGRCLSCSHS